MSVHGSDGSDSIDEVMSVHGSDDSDSIDEVMSVHGVMILIQ